MRLTPLILLAAVAVIGGVAFFLSRTGPEPVAYIPAANPLDDPYRMGSLAPEVTTVASLPDTGSHNWTFDGRAGDEISVQLIAPGGTLTITPPDDIFPLVRAEVDREKGTAEICSQPLAQTGVFTLEVAGVSAGPPDEVRTYAIRIERLGQPTDEPFAEVTENLATDTGTIWAVRTTPCQEE